jgi:hypothetical protein
MNTANTFSTQGSPDARILPGVWKLLLLRVHITYNSFRHARLRRKIGIILLFLMVAGFGVFILSMSWLILGFLRSPQLVQYTGFDLKPFLEVIPALTLAALFLGTLFTSFGVLLQALYLSGDMDFLLSSPVPIRAVFITKLLQAVLPNFALICLFGIPLLFGLGLSGNYNFVYYPFVLLVMVALALAAAGLSSMLVMLVVRILPPRRAAEILGFIGATLGLACSQLGNLANSFGRDISISGTQISGVLLRWNSPWSPLNWAGQGLVALGEGRWLTATLLLGLTLGLAMTAFWFALVTAERWFYSGWAGMQVIARKKKPVRTSQATKTGEKESAFGLIRFLPAPVLGIVHKDFLVLRRDLRNLAGLISPLILGVIYTAMIFRNGSDVPAGRGEAPTWFMDALRVVISYSSVGMSLFVGWILLSRLAGMGFSQEGKNYWILKASPVHTGHLLVAKFLVSYLPALGLGLIFLTGISILQKAALLSYLYSLVAMIMCLAGMAGILLAFGVMGANFVWDDPRKIHAGGMGCLGQLLTMLYLPIALGLFIAPLGLTRLLDIPAVYGYLTGLVIGSVASLGCAILPPWLVRKKAERLNEE